MHRKIVYSGQQPLSADLLTTNKNAMIANAKLAEAVFGKNTVINGLDCIPSVPAALTVKVTQGEIYSMQNIDDSAYSSLAADTTSPQILKQGILEADLTLSTPAPATAGQSINYLVQVRFQTVDEDNALLSYYNSTNPSIPFTGDGNNGLQQPTSRKDKCIVAIKAGASAATGSQVTPSPDAGYIGLYVVSLSNGQTSVSQVNITSLNPITDFFSDHVQEGIRKLTMPTVFNSILKPTAAPTPANPSQLLINNNNEVFMWIGTVWMLVGSGHAASVSQSADIVVSDSVYTQLISIVTPRSGSVLITTSQFFQRTSGSGLACGAYLYKNGAPISRLGLIAMGAAVADTFECSGATILDVTAGDVLSVISTLSSPGSTITSKAAQDSLKYFYLT